MKPHLEQSNRGAAMEQGVYGNGLGSRFRLNRASAITTLAPPKSELAVSEIANDNPDIGGTSTVSPEDACLVHPSFYLPRPALEGIAEDVGERAILAADLGRGRADDDPVVRSLGDALLPALANPGRFNMFFVDGLGRAHRPHIARSCGSPQSTVPGARGGLAPWQERRAKELLSSKLSRDMPLAEIACECGLSPSHFARAFRQSLGTAPHQWRLTLRVERAKEQLLKPNASLADIAIDCCFADQSHFTRVFTKHVGASPGQWRRPNASSLCRTSLARRSLNTSSRERPGQNAAVSFNSARATAF
jgi:AraC-like DNA-binding protein